MSLSIYLYIYISTYPPIAIYLSIYLYLYMSLCLSLSIYIYIYICSSLYDRVVYLEKSKLTIMLCVRRVALQLTLNGAKVSIYASICKYVCLSVYSVYLRIHLCIYLSI